MANLFCNCLLVRGPAEQLDALLEHVRGTDASGAPLMLDFETARPVPNELVESLSTVGWEAVEGWWQHGDIRAGDVWVVRYEDRLAFAIECRGAPPVSIVASLARRFPDLAFTLLWTDPGLAGSGAIVYDSDGFYREAYVPPEEDARDLLRSAGWDERTWRLDDVLPPPERIFEFGRYSYTVYRIAEELQDSSPAEDYGLTQREAVVGVLSFTDSDVDSMIALAAEDLDDVDDTAGIDETTLLCRSAVRVIAKRRD